QDILSQSLAAGDTIDVVTDKVLSQCSLKRSH
ncbi:MAG: hypothetical protein ACI9UN_003332, partial [Granulosicoccus sp.]